MIHVQEQDGQRERDRKRASDFRNAVLDKGFWVSIIVAVFATAIGIARLSLSEENKAQKPLFLSGLSVVFFSALLDWVTSISVIEDLRALHAENKHEERLALAEQPRRQLVQEYTENSTGVPCGISIMPNVVTLFTLGFNMAAILAFQYKKPAVSEILSIVAPLVSSSGHTFFKMYRGAEVARLQEDLGRGYDTKERRNLFKGIIEVLVPKLKPWPRPAR